MGPETRTLRVDSPVTWIGDPNGLQDVTLNAPRNIDERRRLIADLREWVEFLQSEVDYRQSGIDKLDAAIALGHGTVS